MTLCIGETITKSFFKSFLHLFFHNSPWCLFCPFHLSLARKKSWRNHIMPSSWIPQSYGSFAPASVFHVPFASLGVRQMDFVNVKKSGMKRGSAFSLPALGNPLSPSFSAASSGSSLVQPFPTWNLVFKSWSNFPSVGLSHAAVMRSIRLNIP